MEIGQLVDTARGIGKIVCKDTTPKLHRVRWGVRLYTVRWLETEYYYEDELKARVMWAG